MSKERITKDKVEYIGSKFAENPGHFAATILQMYWDMEKERDQYKHCVDDLIVLRTNNKRLEHENKALCLQAETYFDEWQTVKKLYSEAITKHNDMVRNYDYVADKYTALTNHIRMKAEHNPGVSRYIDLVNYIDRLERD